MKLIEQLGGYEKAKEILDSNIADFDGDASGVKIHYMGDCFYQEDLDLALLQHRRENNIYEKGDWLINTETGTFGDFVKYIELNSGHKHCLVDIGLCDLAVFCSKNIRHATDAEIKAKMRLEVG